MRKTRGFSHAYERARYNGKRQGEVKVHCGLYLKLRSTYHVGRDGLGGDRDREDFIEAHGGTVYDQIRVDCRR